MVIFIKVPSNIHIYKHLISVKVSLHNSPYGHSFTYKCMYNRNETDKFNLIISVQVISEGKYKK